MASADLIPDIVDILMQIPLISTGIVLLFFTYGIQVQKEVINNQLKTATAYCTHPLSVLLPDPARESLRDYVKTHSSSTSANNSEIEQTNANLKNKVVMCLVVMFVVFTIIIATLLLVYKHPFPWVSLFNSIVIMGFVMLTEYIFVTLISSQYMVVDVQGMYAKFVSMLTV